MTRNQSEETKAAISVAVAENPSQLARIIEDPFASALAATAVTMSALGFVLTGMWIINLILS